MKSPRFFFAIAALISASLACSLLNRGSEAIQESVPPLVGTEVGVQPEDLTPFLPAGPGQESGTTSGGGSLQAGESYDFDNPNFEIEPGLFNTYKAAIEYRFSAANGVTGTLVMAGQTQIEPYATALTFDTSGLAITGSEESMTFVQLDGNEYMYSPDFGCVSGIAGLQGNPFEIAVDTYGVLTGEAAFSGEETINGVDTYRYTITNENINPLDGGGLGITDLTDGRIYLARDGGYVVRVLIAGRGVNEGLSQDAALEGDISYELNFYDFDLPITVAIPEGCADTGQDTAVPIPDDASEITQFGDILSFSTGLSLEATADFYENEMPDYGCSEPEVVGDGSSMVSMNFNNCEFGSVQIILTVDQNKTVGTIFIAP